MADKKQKDTGGRLGAFIAGATAAATAGAYFLYGSKGAEKRRAKVEGWTLRTKAEVLDKVEKTKELSEEKYNEIVDKATDKYAKTKDVTGEETNKFKKELKGHWKRIKRDVIGG